MRYGARRRRATICAIHSLVPAAAVYLGECSCVFASWLWILACDLVGTACVGPPLH